MPAASGCGGRQPSSRDMALLSTSSEPTSRSISFPWDADKLYPGWREVLGVCYWQIMNPSIHLLYIAMTLLGIAVILAWGLA
jgi:hypothetical protein